MMGIEEDFSKSIPEKSHEEPSEQKEKFTIKSSINDKEGRKNSPEKKQETQVEKQDPPEHPPDVLPESVGSSVLPEESKNGLPHEAEKKEEDSHLVTTGVPGFDELVEKRGVPKGISVLVSGGAGSGKTTFCLQTLNHGASSGEKCLYLSFEESPERLKSHMRNYGWDPDKLEQDGNLVIKRMDPFDISRSVEALLAKARGELLIDIDEIEGLIPRDFHPDRIVLDSLSAVSAAFAGREEGYRIYIEQLFKALEKINATSFLITELDLNDHQFSRTGVEEFLSDAVFAFYNMRKGNIRVSATEIVKLRGAAHKKKIVPFSILGGKGIEVYPQEEIFVDT